MLNSIGVLGNGNRLNQRYPSYQALWNSLTGSHTAPRDLSVTNQVRIVLESDHISIQDSRGINTIDHVGDATPFSQLLRPHSRFIEQRHPIEVSHNVLAIQIFRNAWKDILQSNPKDSRFEFQSPSQSEFVHLHQLLEAAEWTIPSPLQSTPWNQVMLQHDIEQADLIHYEGTQQPWFSDYFHASLLRPSFLLWNQPQALPQPQPLLGTKRKEPQTASQMPRLFKKPKHVALSAPPQHVPTPYVMKLLQQFAQRPQLTPVDIQPTLILADMPQKLQPRRNRRHSKQRYFSRSASPKPMSAQEPE
jgi:hypothetical protein